MSLDTRPTETTHELPPEDLPRQIVVVDRKRDRVPALADYVVVTAREYLSQPAFEKRGLTVVNLSRNYAYQSLGYYCSLLGEARGHRMVPAVGVLTDLSRKSIYSIQAGHLEGRLQQALSTSPGNRVEITLLFGQPVGTTPGAPVPSVLADLGRRIFEAYPCPILKVVFKRQGSWHLHRIRAGRLSALDDAELVQLAEAMRGFLLKPRRRRPGPSHRRYDLAILYNAKDPLSPSDPAAIKRFVRAGKPLGFNIDVIDRHDYARLAEYDALFIRETTRVDHHTYRFARKAEMEGMVVMDDPTSIMRCTNKVYLAERLRSHRIPHPETRIIQRQKVKTLAETLTYPVVLKIPDGAFSRGVSKANNPNEFVALAHTLFAESALILTQEFLYTEYDWRIGVLNRRPLFACQYFMSRNHWQIVEHKKGGKFSEGGFRTHAIDAVPPAVVNTALRAASLFGNGLYGVDLKVTARGVFVIEVNDNPNIQAGVEDAHLKSGLYTRILEEFGRRIEILREP